MMSKIASCTLFGLLVAVSACTAPQRDGVTVETRHSMPVVLHGVSVGVQDGCTLITGSAQLRFPTTPHGSHVDVTIETPDGQVITTGTLPYSKHLGGTRRSASEAAFAGRLNLELAKGSVVILSHHGGDHDG